MLPFYLEGIALTQNDHYVHHFFYSHNLFISESFLSFPAPCVYSSPDRGLDSSSQGPPLAIRGVAGRSVMDIKAPWDLPTMRRRQGPLPLLLISSLHGKQWGWLSVLWMLLLASLLKLLSAPSSLSAYWKRIWPSFLSTYQPLHAAPAACCFQIAAMGWRGWAVLLERVSDECW